MFHSPACLWSPLPGWWPVPGLWFVVGWGSSAVSHVGWGVWARPAAGCEPSPDQDLEQPTHRARGRGCGERLHGGWWWELELDRGLRLQEELKPSASPRLGSGR